MPNLRYINNSRTGEPGTLVELTTPLQFYDDDSYIYASSAGVLNVVAGTELVLEATTITLNGAFAFSGTDKINLGTSGSPLTLTAGTPVFTVYTTCAGAVGTVAQPILFNTVLTGAGQLGGRVRVNLSTDVTLGSYANAFKASIELNDSGGTTGLLSVICSELTMATGNISGTYAIEEWEMTYAATGSGSLPKPCFVYANTNGTARTNFDTYGDFIIFGTGFTAATGKIFGAGTSTIRIGTGALGATKRYIPLSTAGDSFTTAYPIELTCSTEDTIDITITNPSAAINGLHSAVNAANTWSGSIAGVRSTVTSSATASIGNAYAGRFELIQSALPSSQGHTTALYAQTTVTGSTNNPTGVLTLCLAGATGGSTTPFILFQDASTAKSTVLFSVGSAGNLVGTDSGDIYRYETLRILANASARYIPLSTAEGTYTSAYPIVTTNTLTVGASGAGTDVTFYGDIANSSCVWDASANTLKLFTTYTADAQIETYDARVDATTTYNTAITTGKFAQGVYIGVAGTGNVDSGGFLFPLWIDSSGTGTNNGLYYMTRYSVQSGGLLPNTYIQFQTASPGVEHLFKITGNVAPYAAGGSDCTASGATDPKGTLAIEVSDGSTAYIRVWAAK